MMSEFPYENSRGIYEIKLKGHLNESWAEWLDGLSMTYGDDGTTILTGKIVDQAALHGILKKINDLGIPLISVNRLDSNQVNRVG